MLSSNMSYAASGPARAQKVRLGQVALPTEHGSWGFLFEPIVAGLALAPSVGGIWLAVMVIGAFLLRQPLKVVLITRKRPVPQTAYALRFALIFGVVMLAGFAGSIICAPQISFVPLILAVPLAAYQIYCDAGRRSRQLTAELLGSTAIASSIASIAIAGGWGELSAGALWLVMTARLIPSILYVRNRLDLEKGKTANRTIPIAAHLAALTAVAAGAAFFVIPKLTLVMFAILLARCAFGLSSFRKKVKAMRIGIGEVIYGTLTVISLIVGYYTGI